MSPSGRSVIVTGMYSGSSSWFAGALNFKSRLVVIVEFLVGRRLTAVARASRCVRRLAMDGGGL